MTATEPPAAPPPPAQPEAGAPQTTHSSSPACAKSKACTHPDPACPVHFQYLAETAGLATSTAPPPTWRWPQLRSQPANPPKSSANPRALGRHTPPAHTAPHHPPATTK